jgi:hypothetical protein
MKKVHLVPFSVITVFIILVSLALPMPVRAAGTIGDGTPGTCNEGAVDIALSGGGSVNFDCGPNPLTITFTSQKTITINTTIDGNNLITLSGGNMVGIFMVNFGSTLTLKNLNLANGSASQGGAINNDGTVLITNVLLTDNQAPGGIGGGIYNNGMLTITNSFLSNNIASAGLGGAIDNQGVLTIQNSTLSNNFGGLGGGGLVNSGTTMITSSTFTANKGSIGGAISNNGSLTISGGIFSDNVTTDNVGGGIDNSGILMISDSTFSGNSTAVSQKGGGLYNEGVAFINTSVFINNTAPGSHGAGIYNSGNLTIMADAFLGNTASAGLGGGIYSDAAFIMTISNSTFSNNFGGLGGGGLFASGPVGVLNSTFYNNPGGNIVNGGTASINVKNTVLAGNLSNNCVGTITSQGHNLEDAATCSFSGPGDLSNTNPIIGPLTDNGGPTPTHALLFGSPAINAGTNINCPSVDQRGVPRPLVGTCDIGAYEHGFLIHLPLVRK